MPVYKCVFGIFQRIEIKQLNDILRQLMPEKLLRRSLACKNLFEKFIMRIADFSHNESWLCLCTLYKILFILLSCQILFQKAKLLP